MDFMYLANDYKQVLVWLCCVNPGGTTKLHIWHVDNQFNAAYYDVGLAGLVNDF